MVPSGPRKYLNLKAANVQGLEMWFVGSANFLLDNGNLFLWNFCRDAVNFRNSVVFSLDYLLQIKVDYL